MPSTYDSMFWLQSAQETQALAEQMKDTNAREGMARLARKYKRIALQSSYHESRIAFDSAREAHRVSQGEASAAQISSLTTAVDIAWSEKQKARDALEAFRRTHLRIVDGVEVIDDYHAASSAR